MTEGSIPHSRPLHGESDVEAAASALRGQSVAAGALERELEARIAGHFGAPYAASAASGTLALLCALRAVGVKASDEVVIPTYVCAEVVDAVRYLGAHPVLCDVDADTFAPSAATVEAVRTGRTRAVVLPHMFGIPAGVEDIVSLGLPVVEDLAQGLGAVAGGRPAGSWGAAAILSFKAIKVLSAGEGGAAVLNDPEAAARLRRLHEREDRSKPLFDFPLSDLAAAVALSQWARLDEFLARRRALAGRYHQLLEPLEALGVERPAEVPGHAWFRYPVTLPAGVDPRAVIAAMGARGVHVRIPVDTLLHRQLGGRPEAFPVAERLFAGTLSLPLYPALSPEGQERVAVMFREVVQGADRSIG